MSEDREENNYYPLVLSVCAHLALAAIMMVGWLFHAEKKVAIAPPAMMKASLVYAPKSTLPQQKTQTQKIEKPKPVEPKPEPIKPEPPKPEVVKPAEIKPQVKPTEKPSPIAAKPEPAKPEPVKPEPVKQEPKKPTPKEEPKKPVEKKVEPPKPDAKQAEKKQAAQSAIEKEKAKKDAEMAIQALLNDEPITRTGDLTDDELGKWAGLISSRIEDNWNRPLEARNGMEVLLEIELASNGQVLNVIIVESSGNRAFDLSAETAVRKADRFEEISQMKPEVFNKNFRKFKLKFKPEDLPE